MSTVKTDTLLAQSGNPADPVSIPGLERQFAKAWVTLSLSGVATVIESFNVSSIVDNGVGQVTVNYDAPVGGSASAGGMSNAGTVPTLANSLPTLLAAEVRLVATGALTDTNYVCLHAFSN